MDTYYDSIAGSIELIENIYGVKPGSIIGFKDNIEFLEKTSIGLFPAEIQLETNIENQYTFIVLRTNVFCEDWRNNIAKLFPEIEYAAAYMPTHKKQIVGNRFMPITQCLEVLFGEKIYYIDSTTFFLDIISAKIKKII